MSNQTLVTRGRSPDGACYSLHTFKGRIADGSLMDHQKIVDYTPTASPLDDHAVQWSYGTVYSVLGVKTDTVGPQSGIPDFVIVKTGIPSVYETVPDTHGRQRKASSVDIQIVKHRPGFEKYESGGFLSTKTTADLVLTDLDNDANMSQGDSAIDAVCRSHKSGPKTLNMRIGGKSNQWSEYTVRELIRASTYDLAGFPREEGFESIISVPAEANGKFSLFYLQKENDWIPDKVTACGSDGESTSSLIAPHPV